jgi:hypothetical protein
LTNFYFNLFSSEKEKLSTQKIRKRRRKKKRATDLLQHPSLILQAKQSFEFTTSSVREREATDRRRDFLEDFGFVGN